MLVVTISLDNFSSGLATSAFVAYLSSLTNLKFSATQCPAQLDHAAAAAPDRRLLGVMVEKFGYHNFFLITALLGVPTLMLIALHWRQEVGGGRCRFRNPAAEQQP
jgi:PAT family beta-lactamase induction signal transducer AmpG